MGSRSESLKVLMPRLATATSQILEGNRRPLTRAQLHRKAGSHVAEAVAATCLWEASTMPPLGDYHSVVFTTNTVGGVAGAVRVKSLPNTPALMEVSSGAERPSRKSSLLPDLPNRMTAIGFTLDSQSGSYQRELRIRSIRDIERTALLVLDIFHDAFNYRGVVPIDVEVVYGGRASGALVYSSFTPQEIAGIAAGLGYSARILASDRNDNRTATIELRKGATISEVVLGDRTDNSNMYASGFVGSPLIPAAAKRSVRIALRRDQPRVRPKAWRVGVTLWFEGGVTTEWVARRIASAMQLVAKTAREVRRGSFR